MQTEFTCPSTGANLAFEIQSDDDSVTRMWSQVLVLRCPVCQGVHHTAYRDRYVSGLMAEFRCLPADVKEARLH